MSEPAAVPLRREALDDEADRAGRARAFIDSHFPELGARIPDSAQFVPVEPGGDAFCTHADVWDLAWCHSRGARLFVAAPVPDGFFACGLQYCGSEYLFVLWRDGHRRFAFHDKYRDGMGRYPESKVRVRERVVEALAAWEAFRECPVLAFSGPWGFYNRSLDQFEREPIIWETRR